MKWIKYSQRRPTEKKMYFIKHYYREVPDVIAGVDYMEFKEGGFWSEEDLYGVQWLDESPSAAQPSMGVEEAAKDIEAVKVLEWLLTYECQRTKDYFEDKIIIVDGDFYWSNDKDGDQPISPEDIYILYHKNNPASSTQPTSEQLLEKDKEIEGLLSSLSTTEEQRLEWAEMCIKKQATIEELKPQIEVLQEMYGDLKLEAGEWIEFKEGNKIPDYDEYVLWAFEDGTCTWDALDKDGNPHIYGGEYNGFTYLRAAHWRKILTPMECDELFNIK